MIDFICLDFNRSPKPFDSNVSSPQFHSNSIQVQANESLAQQQLAKPVTGFPIRDTRVFGINRGDSKSPLQVANLSRENSISPLSPVHMQQSIVMNQFATPAASSKQNSFFFQNDFNNNPTNCEKKVFGLPVRGIQKSISPLGNHGVQPVNNERKYFGLNLKQRHNSFSCERHWKESLPIVNIPNTDQLLPSQTKQMQTYINQIPPTEKNLRPSLIGLERRRIRPVWPPPIPGRVHRSGILIEGRGNKMFSYLFILY